MIFATRLLEVNVLKAMDMYLEGLGLNYGFPNY